MPDYRWQDPRGYYHVITSPPGQNWDQQQINQYGMSHWEHDSTLPDSAPPPSYMPPAQDFSQPGKIAGAPQPQSAFVNFGAGVAQGGIMDPIEEIAPSVASWPLPGDIRERAYHTYPGQLGVLAGVGLQGLGVDVATGLAGSGYEAYRTGRTMDTIGEMAATRGRAMQSAADQGRVFSPLSGDVPPLASGLAQPKRGLGATVQRAYRNVPPGIRARGAQAAISGAVGAAQPADNSDQRLTQTLVSAGLGGLIGTKFARPAFNDIMKNGFLSHMPKGMGDYMLYHALVYGGGHAAGAGWLSALLGNLGLEGLMRMSGKRGVTALSSLAGRGAGAVEEQYRTDMEQAGPNPLGVTP
jgi:hypothetical protein